ncbi:MAG TPA: glycoside hydrolase family 2 TIM barrel-domain containing protein [Phycisphaerae bacterium]|jgi:hypothetical protein|nr:MAG: hypothetical protein E4H01_00035 [Xanthomonadales bacterium]HUU96413.1 glycoside hydrolase family 2 TIM barrel-domain containing protein [Phycisphaerae bacterium]
MQILNGRWMLATDSANVGKAENWFTRISLEAQPAPVPGVIQQVFPGYHGVAWYWHTFRLIRVPGGDRVFIRFGAVDYLADVWVNGHHAGSYEGGETPFEFDVTEMLKPGSDNLLAVRVLNPTDTPIDGIALSQTPHRNKVSTPRAGSSFNCGGIMYPVELRYLPSVHLADLFVRPDLKTGRIAVSLTVRNSGVAPAGGQVTLSVAPAAGGDELLGLQQTTDFQSGSSTHELNLTIAQPRLWNLDDPYLYRVTVTVSDGNRRVHEHAVRCGFRDFRVVDGFFHLNGKRLFLKSTHTGNHVPIGQMVAVRPDHVRRDVINAKASGFNCVRFIAGVAWPEQLDFCDEIGMLVYEECFAGWCLEDSPQMGERFDRSTSDMIRRDHNHPSVAIWGLLNETQDGPVFRHATDFLPKLRKLDRTRLVLLGSGRWDGQWAIGSASNPDSDQWEHVWGVEGPGGGKVSLGAGGYVNQAGDAHYYPLTPQLPPIDRFMRELGRDGKPIFLSEYGIGSLFDVISEWRGFEQAGARADLEDAAWVKRQSEALAADWNRLGFDDVYPFPEDLLRESQRLHARQRTLGFNTIRSNPKLCGYNLTGMLDHGMTGEGLWKFWRQWKPATFDAVSDGWSPLRWCLFADPLHCYSGREITIEAVLANEEVLKPGQYPARFRVMGPAGLAWEKSLVLNVPESNPLAIPAIRETIKLEGPAGQYTFAASLERGGAATGGRLTFTVSDPATLPMLPGTVATWGLDAKAQQWLTARGLKVSVIEAVVPQDVKLILVGMPGNSGDAKVWEELKQRMTGGATVLFLGPKLFIEQAVAMDWLPLKNKGRCYTFFDWLYHKECVARRHPVFEGLPGAGIMDMDYYGPVIPHEVFADIDTPDQTIAAAFVTGYHDLPDGYGCSILIGAWRSGEGRFILSTPYVLENLDDHPAADRLLVNLIQYSQAGR